MDEMPPGGIDQNIMLFVDGVLEEKYKSGMLNYLTAHPEQAAKVVQLRKINDDLRALKDSVAFSDMSDFLPDLQADLLDRIDTEEKSGIPQVWLARAASIALLITGLGTGGALWWSSGQLSDRAGSQSTIAGLDGDRSLIRHPDSDTAMFEGGTPFPAQAFDWLASDMPKEVISTPDLKEFGLSKVESNVTQQNDASVYHVQYQDEAGTLIDLFAGNTGSNFIRNSALVPEGHISIHWSSSDRAFVLVAPRMGLRLAEIVSVVNQTMALPENTTSTADASDTQLPFQGDELIDDPEVDTALPDDGFTFVPLQKPHWGGQSILKIAPAETAEPEATEPL